MKCRQCGYEIPEGMLYCEKCGHEVRIVPDYNPLDDMLTEQVKGAINGEDSYHEEIYDSIRDTNPKLRTNGRTVTNVTRNTGRNTGRTVSRNTGRGRVSRNTSDREQRRRQAERKKALRKKRQKRALFLVVLLLIIIVITGIIGYQFSYEGIVRRGNRALENREYSQAIEYFEDAVSRDEERPEAYTGLAQTYLAEDDNDKAEEVFLTAIENQPRNTDIYEACIQFYLDSDQPMSIPVLLDDAEDSVVETLSDYVVSRPQFSLDDEEPFEDVQQLTLTAEDGYSIYYTTDDSDPDLSSTEYTEPIQIGEDETVVKAIAVNKNGVPSLTAKRTYVVELPIEDAPAVSPSTGQYETATQIEVKVPDGYEAYYTTDKSDPTTASTKYTGPIDMPEGETIFKAILVNGKGRTSGITTRNYMLEVARD